MTTTVSSLVCLPEQPDFFVRPQPLTRRLSLAREGIT
jgi:hypothetical protein